MALLPSNRKLDQALAKTYPVSAVDYLRQHPVPVGMFNEDTWGSFLIWSLGTRHQVFIDGRAEITPHVPSPEEARGQIHSLLERALNIRQLDAGSCNGCEAEITALTNPYYDLERFGIHFVASPKHADMLLVTGPVTRNMADAVRATYEAVPAPKLVVAVGACGCSGGIFAGSHAIVGAVDAVIPVDGYIPGCPPTPPMLAAGVLEVLRRRIAK